MLLVITQHIISVVVTLGRHHWVVFFIRVHLLSFLSMTTLKHDVMSLNIEIPFRKCSQNDELMDEGESLWISKRCG